MISFFYIEAVPIRVRCVRKSRDDLLAPALRFRQAPTIRQAGYWAFLFEFDLDSRPRFDLDSRRVLLLGARAASLSKVSARDFFGVATLLVFRTQSNHLLFRYKHLDVPYPCLSMWNVPRTKRRSRRVCKFDSFAFRASCVYLPFRAPPWKPFGVESCQ